MKLIACTCRGLGNGAAVCGLLNIQKEEEPDVVFISENKMDERRIECFRWMLGMCNMMVKDCVGRSGAWRFFGKRGLMCTSL